MQDLGLNQYLQPVNTPIDQNKGAVSSYSFDAENERNTVTLSKIKNFSFSAGTGGTLQLGGTANGDGLMVVKNESGNTIIQADSDGHHYYDNSGNELVRLNENGLGLFGVNQNAMYFAESGTATTKASIGYGNVSGGILGIIGTAAGIVINSTSGLVNVRAETTLTLRTNNASSGSATGCSIDFIASSGNMDVYCNEINFNSRTAFKINGSTKTAIVPTTLGYRALYTSESPNVWFFDFATVVYPKWYKFWEKPTYIIDPLFLETIESISHIIPTTNKNIVQVWGIRKGFKNIRMEKKTKSEFDSNNKFWSSAHTIRSKWK